MKIKNVQSIIYLVILLLFANQALAAEWIYYVSIPSQGAGYYDKSSIKKVNKNIIRVWTKTIFNEKGKTAAFSFLKSTGEAPDNLEKLSYEFDLNEIDCVNEKIKFPLVYIYNEDGAVIYKAPADFIPQWYDTIPSSNTETLKNIVCRDGKTSKTKGK